MDLTVGRKRNIPPVTVNCNTRLSYCCQKIDVVGGGLKRKTVEMPCAVMAFADDFSCALFLYKTGLFEFCYQT